MKRSEYYSRGLYHKLLSAAINSETQKASALVNASKMGLTVTKALAFYNGGIHYGHKVYDTAGNTY
jgi:hypothetical protein